MGVGTTMLDASRNRNSEAIEMHARHVVSQLGRTVILLLSAAGESVKPQTIQMADQLNQVGIEQYKQSRYVDALSSFNSALGIYAVNGEEKGEATVLSEIAMCFNGLGQRQRAPGLHVKSLSSRAASLQMMKLQKSPCGAFKPTGGGNNTEAG
jgi:hypothetical protein